MSKYLVSILLILSLGCEKVSNVVPACPPEKPQEIHCKESIVLLDEQAIKQGISCPDNTKMSLPSYFGDHKVLILCECRW